MVMVRPMAKPAILIESAVGVHGGGEDDEDQEESHHGFEQHAVHAGEVLGEVRGARGDGAPDGVRKDAARR